MDPVHGGAGTQWAKNVIRTALVASTAFIATQSPYFGTVLRTVGGFTDAFQSYVVPSLISIVMFRTTQKEGLVVYFYVSILLWGSGLMVFTLVQTFQSVFI
jgi:hypothetical protein